MAGLFLIAVMIYLVLGLLVGTAFIARGIDRVDPVAAQSPWVFRLVVLPGCVGLWPVVLFKWMGAGKGVRA